MVFGCELLAALGKELVQLAALLQLLELRQQVLPLRIRLLQVERLLASSHSVTLTPVSHSSPRVRTPTLRLLLQALLNAEQL